MEFIPVEKGVIKRKSSLKSDGSVKKLKGTPENTEVAKTRPKSNVKKHVLETGESPKLVKKVQKDKKSPNADKIQKFSPQVNDGKYVRSPKFATKLSKNIQGKKAGEGNKVKSKSPKKPLSKEALKKFEQQEVRRQKHLENLEVKEKEVKKKIKRVKENLKCRLHLKTKSRIHEDAQILALHPDINSVIKPRGKKHRWCWLVFANEEKAKKAFEDLKTNQDLKVNWPKIKMNEKAASRNSNRTELAKNLKKKMLQGWL